MRRLLSSIVDIRKGEGPLVAFMFFYYYLILITYYFLKPARDSLFLVKLGPEQLPFVFMLIALIVAPIATLYSRSTRSLSLSRVMNLTIVILILNLVALRWLLQLDHAWIYFVFYVWVSIYAVLGTSQFWLLANTIFDPAQAKRVFWFLNLGGILGAMTGGEVTNLIVRYLGLATENLLFLCMGLLSCCLLILNAIARLKKKESPDHWSRAPLDEQGPESLGDMVGTIRQSKQLQYMVGVLSIGMILATFVDFQFKTVSVEAFPEKEDLTAFLGTFYSRLSIISLLIQSFLTYRILRMFGVGGAISFLPVGLLIGSIGMIVMPGLWMGVLLRGTDGSFRYSIDKTSRELLYLPIPIDVKKRIKVFIDMFLDRLFRGIGGGLLLVFTVVLDLSVRQISLIVLPLLILWIFLTVLVRKEYVSAFRKALERRDIDPSEVQMDITEAATVEALIAALKSPNERVLVYALDMLESVERAELIEAVQPLLQHSSRDIRQKSLRLLKTQNFRPLQPDIHELLHDSDPQVRCEAVSILTQSNKGPDSTRIQDFLNHSDLRIQAATVQYIAQSGFPKDQNLITNQVIERILSYDGKEAEVLRAQTAHALGFLRHSSLHPVLLDLRNDVSPLVVKEVISSAGRMRDRQYVPWLITKLSTTQYRAEARCALIAFHTHILGTLYDYLTDERTDLSIRRHIPRVLASIPSQESVDVLTKSFEILIPAVQYPVIKALNKLRTRHPEILFDTEQVNTWFIQTTQSYYEHFQIEHLYREVQDGPATDLLKKALRENMNRDIEMMFRLLGLCYQPKDMYSAFSAFVSQEKQMRASAIEFLDSVLKQDEKHYLFPILDGLSKSYTIQKGQELFGLHIDERSKAVETLMRGSDPWLKACATFTLIEYHTDELLNLAKQFHDDEDPVIRETAHLVLRRMKH
ncbi:MAG: Npt1/Npt2 family nucleotide transporter [Nitrospirales bacterium]